MCKTVANIVGVGSTLMCDDGVGPAAIERLSGCSLPTGVRLHDAGLAVSTILGGLEPSVPLVVIDAVHGPGTPGTIYEIHLESGTHDVPAAGHLVSLHELSVIPALNLEALTGRVFSDVTVFGVEPLTLEWGVNLSPAVAGALDKLTDAVIEHVQTRCAMNLPGD